jgi:hypothetical protein
MVKRTVLGHIADEDFLQAIKAYRAHMLRPEEPVATFFASVWESSPGHLINMCETCYARWKKLT